jgi:hypothetical protein
MPPTPLSCFFAFIPTRLNPAPELAIEGFPYDEAESDPVELDLCPIETIEAADEDEFEEEEEEEDEEDVTDVTDPVRCTCGLLFINDFKPAKPIPLTYEVLGPEPPIKLLKLPNMNPLKGDDDFIGDGAEVGGPEAAAAAAKFTKEFEDALDVRFTDRRPAMAPSLGLSIGASVMAVDDGGWDVSAKEAELAPAKDFVANCGDAGGEDNEPAASTFPVAFSTKLVETAGITPRVPSPPMPSKVPSKDNLFAKLA